MNRYAAACAVFVSFIILNGNPYAGIQGESTGSLRLSELIDEALERNPEVMAAKERWSSAQEIIDARRALPDPQLSYTYFVENIETRVGPQRHILGARQTLPFFGKRDLRAEIATKEAENLKYLYEATRSEVIHQVQRVYYDLFYLSTVLDITHNEKALLDRFERIARVKYETGSGLQQNILKVQVEISKLNERLLVLEKQRQTMEAMLNTLLDKPPTRPLGKPIEPELVEVSAGLDELLKLARERRPEVSAAQALVERSASAYKLARKDYSPDLTIGLNYIEVGERSEPVRDNGQDAFSVMLSINLPIWQKKLSAQAKSALKMIASEKSSYQDILNRTLFEVKDHFFKMETAWETIQLYESTLIPQAEQSMESAEAGYITGIMSFLDVLDAERVLLGIRFGYWHAYTDYLKHVSDLERAAGIQLAASASLGVTGEVKEGE
jgi:cobalt-zinc-cadmium efflux system outer membrane protein